MNIIRGQEAELKQLRQNQQQHREGGAQKSFIMNGHSQRYLEIAAAVMPGTSADAMSNAMPVLVGAWMASAHGEVSAVEE